MTPFTIYLLAATLLTITLWLALARRSRHLTGLRGPSSPSLLLGVEHAMRQEVGLFTFKWVKEFGTAYRIPCCFGEIKLLISDPNAIVHVLQQYMNDYPATEERRHFYELVFGRSIIWAVGEVHKRHKRVLSPAFSASHLKGFLTLFQSYADKLTERWNAVVDDQEGNLIDIVPWFHKITLDVMGTSSFSYSFHSLEDKSNPLTGALHDLEVAGFDSTPKQILIEAVPRYLSYSILSFIAEHLPTKVHKTASGYLNLAIENAKEMLMNHQENVEGNEAKDVLSVLVRANREEEPRRRLTDNEVLCQMAILVQAGHHTTGYTLSWILFELSKHPEDQNRIFEEIKATRSSKDKDGRFTDEDYQSMTYLNCVIKEALRVHPVVSNLERISTKDDVIPLRFPITTQSGQTISNIPIQKGQRIIIDIATYHRLESIWGEDADRWNPSRFEGKIEEKISTIGFVANLLTFSGGSKGCLGWRFALMEMRAIVAHLIEHFEFSLPSSQKLDIQRADTLGMMIPLLRGRTEEGPQLPLVIKRRTVKKQE